MDMLMQEYAGMPGYAWGVLVLFVGFIAYKVTKSKSRKRTGGSGGGGKGGTGREVHRK